MANGFQTPALDQLQPQQAWRSIVAAKTAADEMRKKLDPIPLKIELPADCSLVVFGSLARGEWTDESDLDWVLLVDGQVSGTHFKAALKLREEFKTRQPGSSGTFGGLAFSHELVHFIGGQDDTNRSLTLRMLLLLESIPIGNPRAYERVVNSLLDRYLIEPSSFSDEVTPRFLMNDLVRFWRTICVDYADKFHDQAGEKAVLRNVKLRFSRKLIYAAGLDTCLVCFRERPDARATMALFRAMVDTSPLELIAKACSRHEAPENLVNTLFGSYDQFLSTLSDPRKRKELKMLRPAQALTTPLFQELREAGHRFQESLADLIELSAGRKLIPYAIF